MTAVAYVRLSREDAATGDRFARLEGICRGLAEQHGITLELDPEARDRAIVKAGGGDPAVLLARVFKDYPLGLNLLRERTGAHVFAVPAAAVDDPETHLNRLIRENYAS